MQEINFEPYTLYWPRQVSLVWPHGLAQSSVAVTSKSCVCQDKSAMYYKHLHYKQN